MTDEEYFRDRAAHMSDTQLEIAIRRHVSHCDRRAGKLDAWGLSFIATNACAALTYTKVLQERQQSYATKRLSKEG